MSSTPTSTCAGMHSLLLENSKRNVGNLNFAVIYTDKALEEYSIYLSKLMFLSQNSRQMPT
ncbi:unnamed protein product, partial [Ixodes pacificus]